VSQVLTETMLMLSNALLVPDIVLLLLMMALTLVQLGAWTAEALQRRSLAPAWRKLLERLQTDPELKASLEDLPPRFGLFARAFRSVPANREKALDDLELLAERLLLRLGLGIRLGPMLGLAGTLIPLGPALVALSQGDFSTLSTKLVVAFTSTVIGLFVGAACFVMHAFRKRWYTQDLSDIEFVTGRLA